MKTTSDFVPKYYGDIKNFTTNMKFIETSIAAIQFKQETSQGKKTINIQAVFLMGAHLHELPPKDLSWPTWDMARLIRRTEKTGKIIPQRIKYALLQIELDIGEAERFWVPAQNAAKEAILKFYHQIYRKS